MALSATSRASLRVHVWASDQSYAVSLRVRVLVEGALVNDVRIPFEPDGDHQLEEVEDLACQTPYTVFVALCSVERVVHGTQRGGCSPEHNETAVTSPCPAPSPPPRQIRPPPPPSPPRPPPSPPVFTASDRGCKDPQAATYEPDAPGTDPSACVHGVRGCTLPTAANYLEQANLNDGSCHFPPELCAMPLQSLPWVALSGGTEWPVHANSSAHRDGSSTPGCTIGPAVTYKRCLSLMTPSIKDMDAVLMVTLPTGAVAATVEVGMSAGAGRDGAAEFELRLISTLGDVVASSLAVRTRHGEQIPPALLRVEIPDELRGKPGTVLQLAVNDPDDGHSDTAIWADPMLYCEGGCPCEDESVTSAAETSADATATGGDSTFIDSALVFAAGLVVCLLGIVVWRSGSSSQRRWADGEPEAVGGRQSRIVGEVRIGKPWKDSHERRNLLLTVEEGEVEDEDEEDAVATSPRLGLQSEQI